MASKKSPSASAVAMAAHLRSAWECGQLSQEEACRDLQIHQSQFSKLVNGHFKRPTGKALQLFEYSRKEESGGTSSDMDVESSVASLTHSLLRAWDRTPQGAQALKSILDGARRIRLGR